MLTKWMWTGDDDAKRYANVVVAKVEAELTGVHESECQRASNVVSDETPLKVKSLKNVVGSIRRKLEMSLSKWT